MSKDQNEFFFPDPSETADQAKSRNQTTPMHDGGSAAVRPRPDSNSRPVRSTKSFVVVPQDKSSQPFILFLSDQEVARRYSVSRATIWRWAKTKDGFPAPVKIAEGTTRWRLEDLEKFERVRGAISARTNSNGSSEGMAK